MKTEYKIDIGILFVSKNLIHQARLYISPRKGAMNLTLTHMMKIPAIFSQNPNFSIWGSRTNPEPKIIAFGGVATGSIKAKLQPIALPRTGGSGLIEAELEMAIIIGTIIFAEAVFDVNSVRYTLKAIERNVIRERLAALPPEEIKNLPMASARPVSNIWNPNDSPPPKRRRVPQSIFNASFKESVNSPRLRLTGRKKRSPAPIIAAVDSGKCS